MSWQDDIAAARVEKERAELEARQQATDAQAADAERLARLQPQLAELKRVYSALCRQNWPAAYRTRYGLFRRHVSAEMEVPEIVEKVYGESGFAMVTARIRYSKYPSSYGVKITVQAGNYSSIGSERVGDIELRGSRWHEVTPDLIRRAAARYCVTHGVELALE
jgi:hypothetical protein